MSPAVVSAGKSAYPPTMCIQAYRAPVHGNIVCSRKGICVWGQAEQLLQCKTYRTKQHIALHRVWPSWIGDTDCQTRVYTMGCHWYVGIHVVPAGKAIQQYITNADNTIFQKDLAASKAV